MLSLLLDTWERIRPELRQKAGTAVFDAWLSLLKPIALERGVLHLEAKNRLVCEHVTKFYADLISDCLEVGLGTRVTLSVEPAPESLIPDELEVGPQQPVIDGSNRTMALVLQALLEERVLPSNLFFFHGPAGTGKTFLVEWFRQKRKKKIRAFTGESLTKAFQACMRDRRLDEIHAELTWDRPLIVEEVHRMSGYIRVQQEFAKVLDVRARLRQPTIITSRWHPRDIWKLDRGIETYLLSGFVARLDIPGPSARLAYLRALEGAPSRNGRADVIEKLAREVTGGYPELRRAWALQKHGAPAQKSRYWQLLEPRSAFDRLLDRTIEGFDVPREEIVGQSQKRRASQARKVLSWLCIQEGLTRAEVGRYLGGRTRAAISYAVKSLEREMAADDELQRRVQAML